MELLRKKRKGPEILWVGQTLPTMLRTISSHLSMEGYLKKKNKCSEEVVIDTGFSENVVTGVVTAPPSGNATSDVPTRGLKRKIGCINLATRMGRKKKIEKDYDLGATIGQGKFGSVVLCKSKVNGKEYACKLLRKGQELAYREVEIMQHLSGHPGVVMLKAVYEDSELFYLVMELCSGGRLLDRMAREGQYSEHQAANVLKELVLVIKYCHDMGVVHRDIKPENILLTASGHMKLADFGLAIRMSKGHGLSGVVGSPAYIAPEVLVGHYSEKVDIWSAGVLLHALLVGVLPFHGDSLQAVFEAVKKVNLDFESGIWDLVSQPARDLVSRMLTRDVSARLTADEVLRHPWMLFYTEPTLTTLTFKSKSRNHITMTSRRLTIIHKAKSDRKKTRASNSLSNDNPISIPSSDNMTIESGDHDCELVDALAVAISRVTISEPKRSRLCVPASPIQQEHSSNMKVNNLCTAF